MSEQKGTTSKSAVGGLASLIVIGVVLILLAISNPSEQDMRTRISADGWVPVRFDRVNLVVLNFVKIEGFTGAEGVYLGVFGQITQLAKSQ